MAAAFAWLAKAFGFAVLNQALQRAAAALLDLMETWLVA